MQIEFIGQTFGPAGPRHFMTTYLVNGTVAIDAGWLGCVPVEVQQRVRHVLVSHSHIDHIATLPLFLETVRECGLEAPRVYGNAALLECLRRDVFNDRVWSDLTRGSGGQPPGVRLVEVEAHSAVHVEGLTITPVECNHVVEKFGYLVDDGTSAVLLAADTGVTSDLWEVANQTPHLKAVFLEAAFPDSMQWLADKALHLTPSLFSVEVDKLQREVRTIVVHIKPAWHERTEAELHELGIRTLEIASPGPPYVF